MTPWTGGLQAPLSLGFPRQEYFCGLLVSRKRAILSEGGKCFIALPSMTNKGQSKIVANLAPGAGVVTTRFQAQYIATEHGIVYLRNLSLAERAKALISIADPSVREELERAAVKRFGIGFLRLK